MAKESWDELAGKLGVSVRNIHRWRHIQGTPKKDDVDGWLEWMEREGKGPSSPQRQRKNFKLTQDITLPGECSYDPAISKGYPAQEALRREQIREQELKNQRLQIEIEKTRKDIYTTEEVRAHDVAWNRAVQDEVEKVQRLLDSIDGIGPEQRKIFLERFGKWRKLLGETLSKVSL